MISTAGNRTITHVVNILNPGDLEYAKILVNYIDESPLEIVVNSAHRYLMELVEQGTICYRPGFKNMFWFFSLEDAEKFSKDLSDWHPELSEYVPPLRINTSES